MDAQKRTICFLLFPGVHLLDLSGAVQTFYEAGNLGNIDYRLVFASLHDTITSEQGLMFSGLKSPSYIQLKAGDFIILPGTDFRRLRSGEIDGDIEQLKGWIEKQYLRGIKLATVCTASIILAKMGLLNSKRCTTHWKCVDYLRETFPKVKAETDKLFVTDSNIYSSAGMTSGIDMSLSIVEEEQGPIVSTKVAREIVVYLRRQGTSSQDSIYLDYHTHFNPVVHKVQNYIVSNPAENPSLSKLAEIGNTSVRSLTRSFKKATGHTVHKFKKDMKLELAKHLINNPTLTIEGIARMCGFKTSRQLQRLWKEKYGTSITSSEQA